MSPDAPHFVKYALMLCLTNALLPGLFWLLWARRWRGDGCAVRVKRGISMGIMGGLAVLAAHYLAALWR